MHTPDVTENNLLIEDVSPELMQKIEERARANSRSVEEEVIALLESGLLLAEKDR